MIVLLSVLAVCSLAWQHLQNQRIELETLPYSSLVRKSLEAKEAKFHSKILRQLKMIQSIMFGRNINKDARAMQGAPDNTNHLNEGWSDLKPQHSELEAWAKALRHQVTRQCLVAIQTRNGDTSAGALQRCEERVKRRARGYLRMNLLHNLVHDGGSADKAAIGSGGDGATADGVEPEQRRVLMLKMIQSDASTGVEQVSYQPE